MITIFNRKELIITMDMKRQADVRNILSSNGVEYVLKVMNLNRSTKFGSSRAHMWSYGVNQNFCYEYRIYVHKDDLEWARYLIR